MNVTAKDVNELRQRTGQSMMECKKVLVEAGGDIEAAVRVFQTRGVKAGIKAREATEGRVFVQSDGAKAVAVEVLCNTDFTARSETVAALQQRIAQKLLSGADAADDAEVKEMLATAAQQTGENVVLGRTKTLAAPAGGRTGAFLYTVTGKIGVLVSLSGQASDELVNDLCLHITAFKPTALGLTRDAVAEDVVAKEREIAVERARATGKPQNIAEKIAEGQMNAFFKERVLGEQEFINPEKFKGNVNDLLKRAGVTLVDYARIEVGA